MVSYKEASINCEIVFPLSGKQATPSSAQTCVGLPSTNKGALLSTFSSFILNGWILDNSWSTRITIYMVSENLKIYFGEGSVLEIVEAIPRWNKSPCLIPKD